MARSSFVSILNNDDNPSFAVRSSPAFTSYTSTSAPPQSDYYPYPFDPVTEAAAQPTSPGSSDCSQDYAPSSCGSTIQPTPSDSFAHPSSSTTTPTWTTTATAMTGPSDSRRSPADPPSPQTSSSLSGPKDSRRGIRKNKYPCPYAASHGCASTFTTSGHAARHGKKHTGEKSVHCPICSKAFTRKDNMKQHIRTHRTHSEDMNNNAAGEGSSAWTKRTPSVQRQQHHRMSYYDDRHYHPPRDRYRSSYHSGMDVVPGGRSSDTLDRDYYAPPPDYGYGNGYSHGGYGYPPPSHRQSRRPHRSGSASEYYGDTDGYDDGYYQRKPRHHRHRRQHRHSSSTSRSPPPRSRHHRSYSESPSPTRNRSRPRHSRRSKSEDKMAQAVRAAITAGAIEAFRVRKEPGEWTGEKGKRILTAAVTAGGADGLVDKDPRKHEKRHIIESTLAGLATNHFVNGPRSRSRSRHHGHGHGREKSSSGHGKELAAAGLVAAAGKKAYDHYRSRSRPRGGDRGRSTSRDDDYDSDGGSRSRGSRRRSKSVSDYINQGLSALGLEENNERDRDHGHRRRHRRHHHRRSPRSDDDSDSGSSGGSSDDSRRRYDRSPRRGHASRYEREVGSPGTIA